MNLAGWLVLAARKQQATSSPPPAEHAKLDRVAAELCCSSMRTCGRRHADLCSPARAHALRGSPKRQKVDEPSRSLSLVARRTNTTTTTSLSRVIPPDYSLSPLSIHTSITQSIINMFPRRFAQSLQAAAKQSSTAPARLQRSAFVSQQFTPAVSQRISGMRMYSDAPASEAKKADEATAEKETKTEEDPIKAELETKKKELLEATVWPTTSMKMK